MGVELRSLCARGLGVVDDEGVWRRMDGFLGVGSSGMGFKMIEGAVEGAMLGSGVVD